MKDTQFHNLAALHRSSHQALVEFIAHTNNVNLNSNHVMFSPPARVVDTWRAGTTDKNTIIRMTTTEDNPDYNGTVIVVYDRLNLADLAKLVDMTVEVYQPQTTHDFIRAIWLRFGIIIDPEDIIDEPLVRINDNELEDPIYEIHATDTSLRWYGTLQLTHKEGRGEFKDFMTEDVLPGLDYPVENDDGTRGSAIVYMYSLDFTEVKDVLETYPVEYVVDETDTALLDAIQQIDTGSGKMLWNLDPVATAWSLHGAEIIASGINDEALPTNKSHKYVLGIRLRSDVDTPPGDMYLHYNDVFDPTKLVQ
jgi:hypothetical protein